MTFKPKSSFGEPGDILLSTKLTTLIIIDHQVAFEPCFDAKAVAIAENGVAELAEAAGKFSVPIITSLVKTNLIDSKLSSRLEQRIPQLTRLDRSDVNPWNDPEFANAVQMADRKCLLIAGLSAETSLSFTALSGLARGFDVFVIRDTCLGFSEQSISTSFDRLTQAGVVPVSWRQVILEWSQGSVDASLLRRLLRSRRRLRHKELTPRE